jgi:hypothetical protein
VNTALTAIAATILLAVVAIYLTLTILPLYFLDCPYRTPLSGAFWRLWKKMNRIYSHDRLGSNNQPESSSSRNETMVQAMSRTAMDHSADRPARDYRALVWTVKSLADDMELEPFVEAIPDALSTTKAQIIYGRHVRSLLEDRSVQLLVRIRSLCESCSTGLLSSEGRKRRLVACYKALWTISSLSQLPMAPNERFPPVDFHIFTTLYQPGRIQDSDLPHYGTSAKALMRWSTFSAVDSQLAAHIAYLTGRQSNPMDRKPVYLGRITSFLRTYRHILPAGVMPSLTTSILDPPSARSPTSSCCFM